MKGVLLHCPGVGCQWCSQMNPALFVFRFFVGRPSVLASMSLGLRGLSVCGAQAFDLLVFCKVSLRNER